MIAKFVTNDIKNGHRVEVVRTYFKNVFRMCRVQYLEDIVLKIDGGFHIIARKYDYGDCYEYDLEIEDSYIDMVNEIRKMLPDATKEEIIEKFKHAAQEDVFFAYCSAKIMNK